MFSKATITLPLNEWELIQLYLRELASRVSDQGCEDIPGERKRWITRDLLESAAFEFHPDAKWQDILSRESAVIEHLANVLHYQIADASLAKEGLP